jgi:Uma2 family endonuclease
MVAAVGCEAAIQRSAATRGATGRLQMTTRVTDTIRLSLPVISVGHDRAPYNAHMATSAVPFLPVHHLDASTYGRMVESGALDDAPVELLEGLLVDVSPHGPKHAAIIEELTARFARASGRLRVQLPLEVSSDSVPEPDLAVVEPRSSGGHPRDALVVVEVTDSSQAVDRQVKAQLYARAGVPTYWLVDVPGRVVEVRTEPRPKGYGRCDTYGIGTCVPSPAAGVAGLDVAELFEGIGD